MFAVVRTGGKQYRVAANDKIIVEKLDAEPGARITLDDVLLVADGDSVKTGAGAKVEAEVVDQNRSKKIIVLKKKRRHRYRLRQGHRQSQTVLKILSIA